MIVPALTLTGTPAEQLKALDAAIARLMQLRSDLSGELPAAPESAERYGRHLAAPVWPWFLAGWLIGASFVVALLVARAWAN